MLLLWLLVPVEKLAGNTSDREQAARRKHRNRQDSRAVAADGNNANERDLGGWTCCLLPPLSLHPCQPTPCQLQPNWRDPPHVQVQALPLLKLLSRLLSSEVAKSGVMPSIPSHGAVAATGRCLGAPGARHGRESAQLRGQLPADRNAGGEKREGVARQSSRGGEVQARRKRERGEGGRAGSRWVWEPGEPEGREPSCWSDAAPRKGVE